jgi:hypothetical protein
MLGTDLAPLLRTLDERHPEVAVHLERLRWWNHGEAPADGRVDIAVIRLPVRSADGLGMRRLYREPLVVALPADHPLAAGAQLPVTALAGEPVLRYADAGAAWNAFWTVDPRPDGTQPRSGPEVRDMEEIVEYVRAGRGIAFLPAPVTAAFPRPGIAYIPVTGVPRGTVVLAWPTTPHPTAPTATLIDTPQPHRPGPGRCGWGTGASTAWAGVRRSWSAAGSAACLPGGGRVPGQVPGGRCPRYRGSGPTGAGPPRAAPPTRRAAAAGGQHVRPGKHQGRAGTPPPAPAARRRYVRRPGGARTSPRTARPAGAQ